MKTAICIASGPSLTQEDVDYCRGKGRVIVVNEGHIIAPWADVLYAADTDWWEKNKKWQEFKGRKVTVSHEASLLYGLEYMQPKSQWHWSEQHDALATGGNSGFQAMNLAYLQGAEQLVLLGYDYGYKPGTKKHWWDKDLTETQIHSPYKRWNERLANAVKFIPIPILNASRESSITCLPRVNLRDVI